MIIYAPQGIDTTLELTHESWSWSGEGFTNSIIHANYTDYVILNGSTGNRAFQNVILYAYNASEIMIDCKFGFYNCQNMTIYTYDESFSEYNGSLPDKLTIYALDHWDELDNLRVYVSYNNYENTWMCTFQYDIQSGWNCNGKILTLMPTYQTITPTFNPTNTPTISPIISTPIPTAFLEQRSVKIVIFGSSVVIGIVISCCCFIMACFYVCTKYRNKNRNERNISVTDDNNTSVTNSNHSMNNGLQLPKGNPYMNKSPVNSTSIMVDVDQDDMNTIIPDLPIARSNIRGLPPVIEAVTPYATPRDNRSSTTQVEGEGISGLSPATTEAALDTPNGYTPKFPISTIV